MKIVLVWTALVCALVGQRIILPFVPRGQSAALSTLTASNFSFDGWIRVPLGYTTKFTSPAGSGRNVSGSPHVFLAQQPLTDPPSSQSIFEFNVDPSVVGALNPATPLASAPRSSLYSIWPDIAQNHLQNYDASCNPLWSSANQYIATKFYYNEQNNIAYYQVKGSYSNAPPYTMWAATLSSPSTSGGTVTYVGGPWRFRSTAQFHSAVNDGTRASDVMTQPGTNKMIIGGSGYFDPAQAWGPNAFRGDWPTGSNPSGCNSTFITQSEELLNFYAPVGNIDPVNTYDSWNGTSSNGLIGQFNWPRSFLTYPYLPTATTSPRINPQTTNRGSVSQLTASAATMVGWFEGTHKRGVIYLTALDGNGAGNEDWTDCGTSFESYRNQGGQVLQFSPRTGSWLSSDTVTDTDNGVKMTWDAGNSQLVAHDALSLINNFQGPMTVGEHVVGFTSGANWVVASDTAGNGGTITFNAGGSGSFTTGETVTGQTSGQQYTAGTWNAGARTLSGNGIYTRMLNGHHVSTSSGGSGTITLRLDGETWGPSLCACTAQMACITGPSANWITPVLIVYDPDDLESVAANTKTDYTVQPFTLIDLTKPPFSLTDLYYNLNVRGNSKGPGQAGGWIDTVHSKMYLFFLNQDQSQFVDDAAIARFSISDVSAPEPLPTFPMALYTLMASLTGWTLLKETKTA